MGIDEEQQLRDLNIELEEDPVDPDMGAEVYGP